MTELILRANDLSVYYDKKKTLNSASMNFYPNEIIVLTGPFDSGKPTLLRSINCIGDPNPEVTLAGSITYNGHNIYSPRIDMVEPHREIDIAFQQSDPSPMPTYENVVCGLYLKGIKDKQVPDEVAESSLIGASIWNEVKDRSHNSALGLSGGQQQHVRVARILATGPKIVLLDEPTSTLDPVLTGRVEDTLYGSEDKYIMLVITCSMQQASHISDRAGLFLGGDLIEYGKTHEVFVSLKRKETEDYITGKFGQY